MSEKRRSWLGTFERALVLCPHTDDEFGCAGAMARLLEEGVELHYYALSRCELSVPNGLPADVLEHECRACMAELGVPEDQVRVGRYPVRRLPEHRQEILEEFVQINRQYRPNLVLLPATFDIHQDHGTVAEEGLRAFKHSTMLGYEMPQNLIEFRHTAFIPLSEAHLERKVGSLGKYESQVMRPYATPRFIRSLAEIRGVQCGRSYAEAFEAIRLVAQ